jgi:hypothetical protein
MNIPLFNFSKKSRQDEFKDELFALLQKYDAEMSVRTDRHGYAVGVNFWAYTKYDERGDVLHDCIDLTLGTWENGRN